jgi:hypothetical protein
VKNYILAHDLGTSGDKAKGTVVATIEPKDIAWSYRLGLIPGLGR